MLIATERTATMNTDLTFLLVHGSWHDGSCWSAVAEELSSAGFPSLTPTLPGHYADGDRSRVTHDDYVRTVVAALDAAPGPVVLVGHSFAGSVISRVAERRPDRCRLLVYCAGFVPRDGERVADSLPPPFLAFLDEASAATADCSVVLPREIFGSAFANTADQATVDAIYPRLVPEPYGPIFELLSLPHFERLGIPAAYITHRQDETMPPGTFHPGQSGRLTAPQLIEIDGDHESLFTRPRDVTWALLEAVGADIRR
jgi:pimeloyl-ACP methyl ester carboxylesterase